VGAVAVQVLELAPEVVQGAVRQIVLVVVDRQLVLVYVQPVEVKATVRGIVLALVSVHAILLVTPLVQVLVLALVQTVEPRAIV
jgi:hypothetical protein